MLAINRTAAEQFKCLKINREDLFQKKDSIILLENAINVLLYTYKLVFFFLFFSIFFFNLIVYYRFLIARILSVLPEIFRNWGGSRPPGSCAYVPKYYLK